MVKEVFNDLAMLADKKKPKDKLSIEVIKKYRLAGNGVIPNESNLFYGIVIMKDGEVFHRPVYPYVPNPSDKKQLERFVAIYEEDLLTFYRHGHNYSFGTFLFGIGSGRKDSERDSWFKKGLVFY